ncbi:MAG: hypothetical protein ACI9PP_000703 [Halobacteriales archaeon]|jgi:hypothetical protein
MTAVQYVAMQVGREATWEEPKAWLSLLGMLAVCIGGILYTCHRYRYWPECFPNRPIVSRFRD